MLSYPHKHQSFVIYLCRETYVLLQVCKYWGKKFIQQTKECQSVVISLLTSKASTKAMKSLPTGTAVPKGRSRMTVASLATLPSWPATRPKVGTHSVTVSWNQAQSSAPDGACRKGGPQYRVLQKPCVNDRCSSRREYLDISCPRALGKSL
jgi:hypothetical protein